MSLHSELGVLAGAGLRLANRIASPLDRLAAGSGVRGSSAVFVVGLPRSGTTLVYELITQAFELAFLTRAFAYSFGLPNISTRLTRRFTHSPAAHYRSDYGRIPGRFSPAENHVIWERWFPADPVLGHYMPADRLASDARESASRMLDSMTAIAKRPFVFKNVYFTMSLPAVLRALPGARFVVVRRPLESVCASVYRLRATKEERWWSVRPPFIEEVAGADAFGQSIFQCVRTSQILEREMRSLPEDRCLVADYEDICTAPRAFLERFEIWANMSLQRRTGCSIPDSFDARTAASLPSADRAQIGAEIAMLLSDRHRYLERVDTQAGATEGLTAGQGS